MTALASPEPTETEEERAAAAQLLTFRKSGVGYFVEQATRPQTIGYALLGSPAGSAGWMLDHHTDAYEKISRAFTGGQPSGALTRDHILDNITLYWLAGKAAWPPLVLGSGASPRTSSRQSARQRGVPGRLHHVPGRDLPGPRSWVERGYPTLVYFHQADRGGHFAASEEAELLVRESGRHSGRCANHSPRRG